MKMDLANLERDDTSFGKTTGVAVSHQVALNLNMAACSETPNAASCYRGRRSKSCIQWQTRMVHPDLHAMSESQIDIA
jgi:hypothetical protein